MVRPTPCTFAILPDKEDTDKAPSRAIEAPYGTTNSDEKFALIGSYDGSRLAFMPANPALRCQSNKADGSSCAIDDGAVGADL